jgi:hypothetical protein
MPFQTRSPSRFFLSTFVLTLFIAAALRLWSLPAIPPGPHYDEAANVVLAAEIAGGAETPIFIPSYTGKETLFFYAVAAAMKLLGVGLLALRLTAALTGLLTVAASAWLVFELFADDDPAGAPWLAALTAALLATSFWHVLLNRLGFRANTQPLLQALTLAALWRGLRRDRWRWVLVGGLLCGLTGYTYLAARVFPLPLGATFMALILADAGRRRRRLAQLALFGAAAALSFAPLGLYFLRHPAAFSARIGQVDPGGDWAAALDGLAAAFKMLFWRGDPYIRFNLPGRPLFGPLVALLFLLGLAVILWRLLRPATALTRARELLLLAWVPIMLLPTALAVGEITPSNLRAVGLIPLVFVLPARGGLCVGYWILGIVQRSTRRTQSRSSVPNIQYPLVLLTLILLCGPALVTARAYFHDYAPRTDLYEASDGDLADIAAYLNQAQSPISHTLYVGSIHYRHPTLAALAQDYPRIKWLVGASTLVYPAQGAALYLFPRSARPDAAWLARYLPGAEAISAPAAPDGEPAFTGYRLASPPVLAPAEPVADFSGVARLLDYRVERAVSGDEADVTLIWQILAPPPDPGLTPFHHLEDPWGSRWGQAEPFHYAAADWTPGEVVVDRVHVPVAPGAPPGDYRLQVGLYSQNNGQRLAVVDDGGRFIGTTAPLTVTVARAETPPDPAALDIRQRLDAPIGNLMLLGVHFDTAQARPGERVHVTLFWRAEAEGANVTVRLSLGETGVVLYEGAPVHGAYPTDRWTAGEIVVDRYDPRLPLVAAAPPGDDALVLRLLDPAGKPLSDSLILGQLTIVAADRTFEIPAIRNTQHAALGGQVELLGYDLDLSDARPGGTLGLTLYWRALAEMETDYTVFTHLLDSNGQTAAQQDNPPVNSAYPTTLWLPGEIVTDPYTIALPTDLPPGDYPIQVGMYIAENGLRLGAPILLNTVVSIQP